MANQVGGYGINLIAQFVWIPGGTGPATLGQQQANVPGAGAAGATGHAIPNAQALQLIQFEQVPGGDSPINTNFQTALNNGAADLYTQITAALLAQMQAWKSGNP